MWTVVGNKTVEQFPLTIYLCCMFSLFQFTGSINTTKGNVAGVTGEMNFICSGHLYPRCATIEATNKGIHVPLYSLSHLGSTLQLYHNQEPKIFKDAKLSKMQNSGIVLLTASLGIDHDETVCSGSGNWAPTQNTLMNISPQECHQSWRRALE